MSKKRLFAPLLLTALAACSSDKTSTTDGANSNGAVSSADSPAAIPVQPPSTLAPKDFSNRVIRLTVPACIKGSCDVINQVNGLATPGGNVALVIVRNNDAGKVTDNVLLLDQIGKRLWEAPSPIPAVVDGPTPEMILDSSGNVLITTANGTGSRVYPVSVTGKEVKDFGAFNVATQIVSDAPADISDTNGDGIKEIKTTTGGVVTTYSWSGGVYTKR